MTHQPVATVFKGQSATLCVHWALETKARTTIRIMGSVTCSSVACGYDKHYSDSWCQKYLLFRGCGSRWSCQEKSELSASFQSFAEPLQEQDGFDPKVDLYKWRASPCIQERIAHFERIPSTPWHNLCFSGGFPNSQECFSGSIRVCRRSGERKSGEPFHW